MPTEMTFDVLSSNKQYTSLYFIKFKFTDEAVLFIWKATVQFRGPFLNFSHIISTKEYEQYAFEHLVI